jgi:AraC family transcriptional regulator
MTAATRLIEHLLHAKPLEDDVDDLLATIPSPVTADRRLARRACGILDECFREPLSIRRLAQELGVHRVYLARVFRLQWDCSPRDYVQRMRVRAATGALASTRRALAEIALDAGFADQSHMTRIFRRRMGITPAAFRRLAQT